MRRAILFSAPTALLVLLLTPVGAWWVDSHGRIADAAATGLPDEMPRFFRAAGKQLAYMAGDPDRWKNPAAKWLGSATFPDHFIDLEDYEGNELPRDRWKAIELLQKLKREPNKAGLLPWAIMEGYDRLSVAFYDYRENEQSQIIQAKCVVYAGLLSHLTGDCAMPLHTTRDYDGRPDKEGVKRQKGIHAKIDGFPEKFGITAEEITRRLKARPVEDVWKRVLDEVKESHKHIDRCYELDRAGAFDKPTKESRAFILERCRAGAQFTMDLWYSAWLRSESLPKHW
jgi:hypothetical protein